jgi:hypothetical protein
MHAYERHAPEMHVYEVHVGETRAYEIYACEMHTYEQLRGDAFWGKSNGTMLSILVPSHKRSLYSQRPTKVAHTLASEPP